MLSGTSTIGDVAATSRLIFSQFSRSLLGNGPTSSIAWVQYAYDVHASSWHIPFSIRIGSFSISFYIGLTVHESKPVLLSFMPTSLHLLSFMTL
jgi:hypothetical protein